MIEENTEEWRDIPGYEGFYKASNTGKVKSIERKVKHLNYYYTRKEKILKPGKCGVYLMVTLQKEGIRKAMTIHRIVASVFLPNPDNLQYVNHKDENPLNNNVENLEWCTMEYNNNYGSHNEHCAKSNTNNPKRSKKVLCVETGVVYQSINEVERQLGFYHSQISGCCNKKYGYKTVKGFHWEWVE